MFTGSYVVNPASGGQIPVFVADYVLMGYGSGAIMAVPAHDQRDLDFAREFGLPVQAVVQPPAPWLAERALAGGAPADEWPEAYTGDGTYVNSASMGIGGSDSGAGIQAAIQWLMRTGHGQRVRSYRLRDWLFSRQRYWGEPIPDRVRRRWPPDRAARGRPAGPAAGDDRLPAAAAGGRVRRPGTAAGPAPRTGARSSLTSATDRAGTGAS